MPDAGFFSRLGLFTAKGFLDAAHCVAIRDELALAPEKLGTIGKAEEIDTSVRSARRRKAPAATRTLVSARLEELRPTLSRHFGLALAGFENVQFLCYKADDFYRPHRDRNDDPDASTLLRGRKVSVVLFLNARREQGELLTYGGGTLTFYGLLQDPRWQSMGLGLDAEEGLLIAFRSDLLHEVTPVTHGERYTIVSWYY
jgi:predicted 2-oxoglutarate/Fe(II)-dependent dioxygenase YbiX